MRKYSDLSHLTPQRDLLCTVSPWPSARLRLIRDDLAPLIEAGCPVTHLLSLLAPLGITKRRDTLRAFIAAEFPAEYARYYARRPRRKAATPAQTPVKAVITPVAPAAPAATRRDTPKEDHPWKPKLGIDRLLDQLNDFRSGAHLNEAGDSNHDIDDPNERRHR